MLVKKKKYRYTLIKDNSKYCKRLGFYRIKALYSFSDVKAGDLGGYIMGGLS